MSNDLIVKLRDQFALVSLREIIARDVYFKPNDGQSVYDAKAELAYIYADAMLRARGQ